MRPSNNRETLNHEINVDKITLQQAYDNNMVTVDPKLLEEYGKVLLTQQETSKQGEITAAYLAELQREQLKKEVENNQVETNIRKAAEIAETADQQQNTDKLTADEQIKEQLKSNNQSTHSKAKNDIIEVSEKVKTGGALEVLKKIGEKVLGGIGWLINFVVGFFKDFFGLFGFGEKAKETMEKLSPDNTKETKKELLELSRNFVDKTEADLEKAGISLSPNNKKEIQNFIETPGNLSDEELENLHTAFSEGKITKLSDIANYLNGGTKGKTYQNLNNILFDEEQREIIKNAGIAKVKKSIEDEFGVKISTLTKQQQEELHKLVKEKGVQEDFIKVAEEYGKGEFIPFAELIKAGLLTVPHMAVFLVELIKILPIEGVANCFAISLGNLWDISKENSSNVESLSESILDKISKLPPEQKNLIFGITLRKGMFAFNLLDKLSFSISRTMIENIYGGYGNAFTNVKIFGMSEYNKQSKLFDSFMNALGKSKDINTQYVKERMNTLSKVSQEAKHISDVMNEMKTNKNDIGKIQEALKKNTQNPIAQELKNISNITELKNELGVKIGNLKGNLGKMRSISDLTNKGGLGIDSELNKYLKSQEGRMKVFLKEWERSLGQDGGKMKFWRKFNALGESMRFSHDMKNIEIHANSLQDGAEKLSHLKAMSIESPKLFGSIFSGFASYLVLDAAITHSDENTPILEEIWNIGKYVIPTLGPIQVMAYGSGIQKSDTLRDTIKMGSEFAGMGILLGMDAAYISQTLVTKGLFRNNGAGFLKILKYHGQIVTAPYDIIKAVNYQRQKMIQYKNAPGNGIIKYTSNITRAAKEALKFNKHWVITAAVISLLGISMYIDSSHEKKLKELQDEGIVDKNGDLLAEIGTKITNEDKKFILEEIVWGHIENIDVTLEGKKTIVKVPNKNDMTIVSLLYPNGLSIVRHLENIGVDTEATNFIIQGLENEKA